MQQYEDNEHAVAVPADSVPRGRGRNPFREPVPAIAERLRESPGTWFLIGTGGKNSRSRLNNAAALLSGGKYKSIPEYYEQGRFETRVSGAKDAPHAKEYAIGVFARWIPKEGAQ